MNKEKAVTGIYKSIRQKLKSIRKEVEDLEIMAVSLELRESLEKEEAEPLFIPDEDEDAGYDFEGEGILLVTSDGVMEFLTCSEADEKLEEIKADIEVRPLNGTPFLASFDKRNAKAHGSSCLIDGELLVFACEGTKLRPLTVSEVCEICRALDDNKHALNLDDTDQHLLVLM